MKLRRMKNNKYLHRKLFFWTWLLCIFGFFGVLAFLATTNLPETPSLAFFGLLGTFALGVGSFVLLISTFALSKKELELNKKKREIEKALWGKSSHKSIFSRDLTFSTSPASLVAIVLVLIVLGLLYSLNHEAKQEKEAQNKPFFERTNIVISPPVQNPTPTIKQVKAYPTTDPDPIIDCESSYPECVGSSIRVRRSQCSKITCCQVGNTWSTYPTIEKCSEAQKESQQKVIQENSVPVNPIQSQSQIVYLTSRGYTVYCKPETVDALKTADQALKKALDDNKICEDKAFQDLLTCKQPCIDEGDYSLCVDHCNDIYEIQINICDFPLETQTDGFQKVLDGCF